MLCRRVARARLVACAREAMRQVVLASGLSRVWLGSCRVGVCVQMTLQVLTFGQGGTDCHLCLRLPGSVAHALTAGRGSVVEIHAVLPGAQVPRHADC